VRHREAVRGRGAFRHLKYDHEKRGQLLAAERDELEPAIVVEIDEPVFVELAGDVGPFRSPSLAISLRKRLTVAASLKRARRSASAAQLTARSARDRFLPAGRSPRRE
jgi:hypothetical protein